MIKQMRIANQLIFTEDFEKVAHKMLSRDEAQFAVLALQRCHGNIFKFLYKNEMYDEVMEEVIKEVLK